MFFHKLPSLAEADFCAATPSIEPVSDSLHRPLWSVMIPSYCRPEYLRKTLASVLCQDPGPDVMEIEVVDNDSPAHFGIERVVHEVGGGRVRFYRQPANVGMVPNWNDCIRRARGRWIHILHDDDMLLPGFYEEYGRLVNTNPNAVMVLGRVITIDESDQRLNEIGPLSNGSPVLERFVIQQAKEQLGQFVGTVVSRAAYEEVGGFCTALYYTADWEMWFRVGECGNVMTPSRAFGLYRIHSGSETNTTILSGANIRDLHFVHSRNMDQLTKKGIDSECPEWNRRLADSATNLAWVLDSKGHYDGRYQQARWAYMLDPTLRRAAMLVKSRVKLALFGERSHSK